MKIVVQRSLESSVSVASDVIGSISNGLVLLVCLEKGDDEKSIAKAAQKILALRIFADEQGRMNKNILQSGGEVLAISQFTLSWNGQKGNRPSFDNSMAPDEANSFFIKFCDILKEQVKVETGAFGESMQVSITNDGPVTFFLEF
jgi:D-tyrosyl-tRNA(Tyr) deacylase